MTTKSGGDAYQSNQAAQGNANLQDINGVAAGGAGVLESAGGLATADAIGTQETHQNQAQNNMATTGHGGDDNVNANTNFNNNLVCGC